MAKREKICEQSQVVDTRTGQLKIKQRSNTRTLFHEYGMRNMLERQLQ